MHAQGTLTQSFFKSKTWKRPTIKIIEILPSTLSSHPLENLSARSITKRNQTQMIYTLVGKRSLFIPTFNSFQFTLLIPYLNQNVGKRQTRKVPNLKWSTGMRWRKKNAHTRSELSRHRNEHSNQLFFGNKLSSWKLSEFTNCFSIVFAWTKQDAHCENRRGNLEI